VAAGIGWEGFFFAAPGNFGGVNQRSFTGSIRYEYELKICKSAQ
jgi:hypothetical protein